MSISNSPRRVNWLAAVSGALILVACFDVENVDVTKTSRQRLLIDDFEDGDLLPSTTLFGAWLCYSFISDQRQPTCSFTAGFDSNLAYSLAFALQSPPIVTSDGVGAGICIVPPVGTVDLSSYETLHFSGKMDPSSPGPPPGIFVSVNLGCNSVGHPTGSVKGGFMVEYQFSPTPDWQSYAIALSDFEQPGWQEVRMFDKSECPKVVDVLNFNVQSPLAIGQSEAGVFTIDNVWLE